jgi:hypothetical protein
MSWIPRMICARLLNALREWKPVKRLLFYSHGEPGVLWVGKDHLMGNSFRDLAGRDYESSFAPGAEIFFDGCEVAQEKVGKWFLESVAQTLLFKAGGRAGGWDSIGVAWPELGGTDIHHFSGDSCYAYVKPGSKQVRGAIGKELASPVGLREVKVNKQVFDYEFSKNPKKFYFRARNYRTKDEGFGTWEMQKDGLKIKWEGESEIWDLPLYDKYQTGRALPYYYELTAKRSLTRLQKGAINVITVPPVR